VLLSPGLAAFLYGISSIPGAKQDHGTIWTAQVVAPALIGLLLIAAFVPWALNRRNIHPLVDLRLFENPRLTIALVAMSLFAIAFFGASLLFPLYFQQVRHEDALHAGLLLAPQGIGAMITMPIAGILADKIGPGKIVMVGIVVITIGMGMFTRLTEATSYAYLLSALFVMGLGMGSTMMPIMSSALATLRDHTIARGSTLMNIVQQVAASVGTAVFSVLLTNGLLKINPTDPSGAPGATADAFATVFVVATIMVAAVLVPAFFLPRTKLTAPVDPAVLVGH
jgi:EmrB/QacA subfamily drug resistance transporter